MAVGTIAKKMLGFADEIMDGAIKGIGDAGTIRASVNRMSSNISPHQAKRLAKFGKRTAGDAAEAVSRSNAYMKNTKKATINRLKQAGDPLNAKRLQNMKGMPMNPARKNHLTKAIGKTDRVAGITNPTIGNRIGDAVAGGVRDTMTGMKSGRGFTRSVTDAFTDAQGKTRMDRVAGTFVGASAAARIATGGGLYKDRNGSTNIIGIPFI